MYGLILGYQILSLVLVLMIWVDVWLVEGPCGADIEVDERFGKRVIRLGDKWYDVETGKDLTAWIMNKYIEERIREAGVDDRGLL